MKRFNITVNGKAYDVAVEEVDATSQAAVSAPAAPLLRLHQPQLLLPARVKRLRLRCRVQYSTLR